jgi:hypothetical protein
VTRIRQLFLLVTSIALLWAALVAITGGFSFTAWGARVSPRSPLNPMSVALVGAAAWALSARQPRRAALAGDLRRFAAPGDYVARRLPKKAAVLAQQHSGSVRYCSGRATVRFDRIPPAQLDSTLTTLAESGYRPYILLEPWEVPQFQHRYAGYSPLAGLDWPPAAVLRESNVRIYDPADRPAFLAGHPPLTELVP